MRHVGRLVAMLAVSGCAMGEAQIPKAVLWWDATANLVRIDSPEAIGRILDKCVAAGIGAIVFDVKPVVGDVLYNSAVAQRLTDWKGVAAPRGFDPLAVAIEQAHARGLKIYASVNVFAEGHKQFHRGLAYERPDLQCVAYDVERRLVFPDWEVGVDGTDRRPNEGEVTITSSTQRAAMTGYPDVLTIIVDGVGRVVGIVDGEMAAQPVAIPGRGYALGVGEFSRQSIMRRVELGTTLDLQGTADLKPIADSASESVACFVNPILPEVRRRELSIIGEIAGGYEIDGIILDRMRYSGIATDFSDASRRAFEADLGRPIERFPEDILTISPIPGRVDPGPLYRRWAIWRARNVKDFLSEARKVVNAARPGALIGVYVGAWYDEYEKVGVNWASRGYPPASAALPPEYSETGYADLCDLMFVGCYYRLVSVADDPSGSVSPLLTVGGSARRAVEVVGGASHVIGSVYLDLFTGDGEQMKRAVRECINVTGGVMLFDLVHVETNDWWDEVRCALTSGG